ncbi:uncharacterized protein LAJ45_04014 [Morchella importuna]|uniref:uncharacterized protein n=1 Tax=Morchella importuna TaxID=1174673 RepID=UPI001E8D42CE|nr:uncharacterized protein LAJ45_04014 [Morchella importuna]KAH8152021.1 hypothetical protein LAJ45_04014 [Morchella importuna]
MPPNPTTLTTHPTSTTPHTHLIYYLLIYLLLFAPPNNTTALAQVAPFPFPFPVLPQEFASKTACREVYDQCMQAFRDCLAAVAGNEPGRLGCEAYRNDVCEEHIRVGCDQLPNGGGSIGEVPSLTTFLTVVPIGGTTEVAVATTTTTATRVKSKTTAPVPVPTDVPTPTPDPPDPTMTRDVPIVITTTTTAPQQQEPPRLTITLTSTATESTSGMSGPGSQTVIVITTVVAATTEPATSTTVTRGLSFNVVSSGVRWGSGYFFSLPLFRCLRYGGCY